MPQWVQQFRKDNTMDKFEAIGNANIKDYKQNLIKRFKDMAERGTLLTGSNITQHDLLIQIIGTIVADEFEK